MENEKTAVLFIADSAIRQEIVDLFHSIGWSTRVIKRDTEFTAQDIANRLLIVETSNDVAWLSQVVYELHLRFNPPNGLPIIIGILTEEAHRANPRVGAWTIKNAAALLVLLIRDRSVSPNGWQEDLIRLVQRIRP